MRVETAKGANKREGSRQEMRWFTRLCSRIFAVKLRHSAFLAAVMTAAVSPVVMRAAEPKPLTEEQQAHLREIEKEFARFDMVLNSVTDIQVRGGTKQNVDFLRKRLFDLRANFDQTRYDELRYDMNAEYQRLARWIQDPVINSPDGVAESKPQNWLTDAERTAGWKLLFDGATFTGWRGFRQAGLPVHAWEIRDGMLHTVPRVGREKPAGPGDLITEAKFRDFELTWEWRLANGANNGVKYFVTEDRPAAPGPEYQMVDDWGYAGEPLGPLQFTAGFYDVLAANTRTALRPVGTWNTSKIVVRANRVEHWLNGQNVLTYELGSPQVMAGIAQSKFKDARGFGEKIAGHIMLTYHNDECWFRNIKIREVK